MKLDTVTLLIEATENNYVKVDLNKNTSFSFNLKYTDISEPTAIEIPFSVQISLPKTQINNDIFNHIGKYSHSNLTFNPIERTNFQLYINGNLYQSGYLKLLSVTQTYYNIRLYGGLGDFFYTLSDVDKGMMLKDLPLDTQFNHRINKELINTIWNGNPYPNSENYCYAMTYQGEYDNFDSDKILKLNEIEPQDTTWISSTGKEYSGVTLNEHKINYQGYYDDNGIQNPNIHYGNYRSYYQKPMVRVKTIMNSIFDKANSEGWEVELDSTFFNQYNPYWEDLWMICPQYDIDALAGGSNLEITAPGEDFQGHNVVVSDVYNFNGNGDTDWQTIDLTPSEPLLPNSNYYAAGTLDLRLRGVWVQSQEADIGRVVRNGFTVYVELLVDGAVQGAFVDSENSSVPNLRIAGTERGNVAGKVVGRFLDRSLVWHFNKKTSSAGWQDGRQDEPFSDDNVTLWKMAFNSSVLTSAGSSVQLRWKVIGDTWWGYWKSPISNGRNTALQVEFLKDTLDIALYPINQGGIRSDTDITYSNIIKSQDTCFDFLTGYSKLFGLHYVKDVTKKKVTIMSRNTYFGNLNKLDWTYKVDYSKNWQIEPVPFDYKVGVFKWNELDTKYENKYLSETNREYGSFRFDTGYQFSNNENNYLEDLIFDNGIIATDYSQYYLDREQILYKDNKILPHLQDTSGSSVDNSFILIFKNPTPKIANKPFVISDDTDPMAFYGYGWADNNVITGCTRYPSLTRNYVSGENTYSLNFGRPNTVYNDDDAALKNGEGSETLYVRFWKEYLEDRFSDENKVLECYINLTLDDVQEDLFNKFIYINDTVWVLDRITNFNPLNSEPTKCRLVKVQSIDSYVAQRYIAGNLTITKDGSIIYDYSGENGSNANPVLIRLLDGDPLTFQLTLNSDTNWTIGDLPSNVTVTPLLGNEGITNLTVTVQPNTSGSSITSNIPIRWGNTITIVQVIQVSNISVTTSANSTTATATANGQTGTIIVEDSISVTFDTTNTNSNEVFGYWLINGDIYTSQTLTIIVSGNTTAVAYWFNNSNFGWTNSTLTIGQEGGLLTNKLNTVSNVQYTITSSPSLVINPNSGNVTDDIVFTIPENTSTDEVVYEVTATYSNGLTRVFTITQDGKSYLTIAPETITINGNSTNYIVSVESNTDWNIYVDPIYDAYFYCTPLNGSGNGTVTVIISPNASLNTRTGEAEFRTNDGSITVNHIITQTAGISSTNVTIENDLGEEIVLIEPIDVTLTNSNNIIVDQYTIDTIPTTGLILQFANKQIGIYTIELTDYTGSTEDGSTWTITPSNSQGVEIVAGTVSNTTYHINAI